MKRKNGLFSALALSLFALSGNSFGSKTKIDYTPCKYKGMTNQELGTKEKETSEQEMKEQDVRIGMKVRIKGTEDACIVLNEKDYRTAFGNVYSVISTKTGRKKTLNACDFEPYIDTQETADALNKAVNNLAETLTKTLQPLIEWISRPEVAKALEALGKDKGNLREEISKAFGVYVNKNDPDFSYFSCFKAGYLAGRESK